MKTEDLIVQLADEMQPVRPLAPPMRRLAIWAAGALALTAVSVLVIGPRADSAEIAQQRSFLMLALLTLATGVCAAGAALVLSVPGAERTPAQHWLPIVVALAWAALLTEAMIAGGAAMSRIGALPIHTRCVIQIAGLGLVPGWLLFRMLRGAAPLRLSWSAGLGALAAVAFAAAGVQFLCPLDDPAHHLVGHFAPVAVLAFAAAWGGIARTITR